MAPRVLSRLKPSPLSAAIWLLVMAGALVTASDQQTNANDGLALARVLPKGALAYLQVRDGRQLFARWQRSPVRNRYYASDSYRAFRRSRLWAKLNERLTEFETGAGLTLTEDTIARLIGKTTAVALYDMGKLELVAVTELSAAQAVTTPLLAQKAQFEMRATPSGQPYLVRELATDSGRRRQGLCVAMPPGKLIVTTTEALMQRTLDNLGGQSDDHLLATMAATLAVADDFTPHDLTLWTDLPRLRQQVYFGYYWIQGAKATALNGIEATLADIEFTTDGIQERRWSLTTGHPQPAAVTAEQQTAVEQLLGAAPFAVVETWPENAAERVAPLVVQAVALSPPRTDSVLRTEVRNVDDDVAELAGRQGRYQKLDARFDRDLDDPNAPAVSGTRPTTPLRPPNPLEAELVLLLRAAQPTCVVRLGATKADGRSPFVTFERAVAICCARPLDVKAYESLMARAIQQRYFVAGTLPPVGWETSPGGVTVPRAKTALERCGAYFLSRGVMVIASSAAYAEYLKARLTKAERTDSAVTYNPSAQRQAVVRLRALAPDYRRVVRMIHPQAGTGLTPLEDTTGDESVAFLEQNIPSLLTVVESFDVVTMAAVAENNRLVEHIHYRFTPSTVTGEPVLVPGQ